MRGVLIVAAAFWLAVWAATDDVFYLVLVGVNLICALILVEAER
jgi:hypothetical protein